MTDTTATELTEEQAFDQLAEWLTAGYRPVWDLSIPGEWKLLLWLPGATYPLESKSTDRRELRVIDCVQRMRRLLAFEASK